MKPKVCKKLRSLALLLAGGMVLGSGACLPNNFWANAWERALNASVDAVATAVVVSQVEGLVTAQ
ncbi:MAG: hypothetical protein KJ749_08065 [Planctomycetes bacterium]|nr:hypothetical protein [Planctomycetota bacterium]